MPKKNITIGWTKGIGFAPWTIQRIKEYIANVEKKWRKTISTREMAKIIWDRGVQEKYGTVRHTYKDSQDIASFEKSIVQNMEVEIVWQAVNSENFAKAFNRN